MGIPYEAALQIIAWVCKTIVAERGHGERTQVVCLTDAVGRVILDAQTCRQVMPAFDSSAMDGYALDSSKTQCATSTNPVRFRIDSRIMAAGDPPLMPEPPTGKDPICVEIMTGAQFPRSSPGDDCIFDACVKVENTSLVKDVKGDHFMSVKAPVRRFENRRFAGSDLNDGQDVISSASVVRSSHVMALAAIGTTKVEVMRKPTVAVICTGSELVPYHTDLGEGAGHASKIRDSNGPYIKSALQEIGVHVDYLGIVPDTVQAFVDSMTAIEQKQHYDLIITTGAVSVGKFDWVRPGLEMMKALIHFHGVAIRPGGPVLFASLSPQTRRPTPVFGLPGNPMAAAICLRLFVMPYLRSLEGLPEEAQEWATARASDSSEAANGVGTTPGTICTYPPRFDVFRHGTLSREYAGSVVRMADDQGPSKVGSWLNANCWVHLPKEKDLVREGDRLRCIPLSPKR